MQFCEAVVVLFYDLFVRAIEDENITADLVYAPKLLGTYGKPSLMRHNKLVYNHELRDKLWSYTANELNLDI